LDPHYSNLLRLVKTIGRDYVISDQDAEDILSLVYMRMVKIRVWERYHIDFESLNWSYSWIRHGIRSYLRDQYRQVHVRDSELWATELSLNASQEAPGTILPEIAPKLSLRDYVVTAFRYEGYNDRETRGATGMSRSIYEDSLCRIRKILSCPIPTENRKKVYTGKRSNDASITVYVSRELQDLVAKYKEDPRQGIEKEKLLWKKAGRKPYKNI
jgi:DNA-directed RNA polymerase specialized sigma24 family protein